MHNTKPDWGWIKKGKAVWIATNGGRKRYNILGAINAHKPEQVTKVNEKRVNYKLVIKLFKSLLKRYRHKKKIHIWVDRARYFTHKEVKAWLSNHPKICVHYLPPYSPNLNLIERLWKFMRKRVVNSAFYKTYKDFVAGIETFFREIKRYKSELRSLMRPNFQKLPKTVHFNL